MFKNKFIAIALTISFVGTSLLAPFTAQAEAQKPMGGEFKQTNQRHNMLDVFTDKKMQADVVGIGAACMIGAYLPKAMKYAGNTIIPGVGAAITGLFGIETTENVVAKAATIVGPLGVIKQNAADIVSDAAVVTAQGTADTPNGVYVTSVTFGPIAILLGAVENAISGLHDTIQSNSIVTEGNKAKKKGEDTIADCIVYSAGQLLLKQLTQDTVNWIKGGYHGGPNFSVNTHEIFLDLADSVAGDLAREVRGISMCRFSANFQNDLANNIELSAKHIYKFNGATKCPFPETFNINSSDFYKGVNNFSWGAMEYAMQDNGNPFGVALLSGQELALRSSEKKDVQKQELSWSNGFTNMVDTDNCNYPDGYTIDANGKGTYDAVNTTNLTAENNKVNALSAEVIAAETALGKATGATYDSAAAKLSDAQARYNKTLGDFNMMGENVGNSESAYVSDIDPKQARALQKTYCPTTTPGKQIGDALTKATGIDMDRLGAVDSVNKIVAAVIEQAMQSASMGIFDAISGQDAKVQQNYITVQDKTAETIAMENYAIKNAKDALAEAKLNLQDENAKEPAGDPEKIYLLQQAVDAAQKKVDAVTSVEYAINRQAELTAANAEVATALSAERSAQARADAASKAYYDALGGSLSGGTYIQPDPATLADLKLAWDTANNAFVVAQGVTANAQQRLYDAQHP